jgi:hypothetical protein
MNIEVKCYAGYRGEETPQSLSLGGQEMAITRVLDRWLAPDHRYFKVETKDRDIYILRHDPQQDRWEMVYYCAIDPSRLPAPGRTY